METVINCTLKEVVLQNFEKKLSCKDSENFQELIRGAVKVSSSYAFTEANSSRMLAGVFRKFSDQHFRSPIKGCYFLSECESDSNCSV